MVWVVCRRVCAGSSRSPTADPRRVPFWERWRGACRALRLHPVRRASASNLDAFACQTSSGSGTQGRKACERRGVFGVVLPVALVEGVC